jgi:plastocyanin
MQLSNKSTYWGFGFSKPLVSDIYDFQDTMMGYLIDELNIRTKRIAGGESDSVTFTADKTGAFEYYCSVGNHREMGMKGRLIVE